MCKHSPWLVSCTWWHYIDLLVSVHMYGIMHTTSILIRSMYNNNYLWYLFFLADMTYFIVFVRIHTRYIHCSVHCSEWLGCLSWRCLVVMRTWGHFPLCLLLLPSVTHLTASLASFMTVTVKLIDADRGLLVSGVLLKGWAMYLYKAIDSEWELAHACCLLPIPKADCQSRITY